MNLKTDPTTGEVVLVNGQFVWLDDDDPNLVAQNIEQRIKSVRGDWYIDLRSGIPWFHGILGEKNGDVLAKRSFRKAIESHPRVKSIDYFKADYNPSTREFTVNWEVLLEDNTVVKSIDYRPIIIRI